MISRICAPARAKKRVEAHEDADRSFSRTGIFIAAALLAFALSYTSPGFCNGTEETGLAQSSDQFSEPARLEPTRSVDNEEDRIMHADIGSSWVPDDVHGDDRALLQDEWLPTAERE